MKAIVLGTIVLSISVVSWAGGRLGPHPGDSPPTPVIVHPAPPHKGPVHPMHKRTLWAKLEVAPYGINEQDPDKIDRMGSPVPTPPPPPPKSA